MAHFAKLDENNIVQEVIVVNNKVLEDADGIESEQKGIDFLIKWSHGHTKWVQCSYTNKIRRSFPGKDYIYIPDLDIFIPPKPFPSWYLNNVNGFWEPPVVKPSDGKDYFWDEAILQWIEIPPEEPFLE